MENKNKLDYDGIETNASEKVFAFKTILIFFFYKIKNRDISWFPLLKALCLNQNEELNNLETISSNVDNIKDNIDPIINFIEKVVNNNKFKN